MNFSASSIKSFSVIPIDKDIYIFVGNAMTGKTTFANRIGGTALYYDIPNSWCVESTMKMIAKSQGYSNTEKKYQITETRPLIILILNNYDMATEVFIWFQQQKKCWEQRNFYDALAEGYYHA